MSVEIIDDKFNISTDYSSDSVSLNVGDGDNKKECLSPMYQDTNMLFGRDIKIRKPICIGNVYAFWYIQNQPLIIIGPHCISSFNP
jgi:hypothetical protein